MRTKLFAIAALAMASTAMPASAQEGAELGLLECVVEGGVSYLIGSTRELSCTFTSVNEAFPPEPYVGTVNRFGLDVGVTGTQVMQWAVFAPTADLMAPGVLDGEYVGATAEATVGVGVGANVLIGGSERTISLQPVSVQAQTGINLALGVTEFRLQSVQ